MNDKFKIGDRIRYIGDITKTSFVSPYGFIIDILNQSNMYKIQWEDCLQQSISSECDEFITLALDPWEYWKKINQ